ncbi:CG4709 [Drosophila busckii]|uniref:Zinc finger CCCH-type with G patch domain-containing protein n=1 Tax=Drosophila busckii TaxID=30019 RepID=A0A0M3QTM2_DROBS|nr:CG4709 [Drosophila busckii]
MEEYEAQLLVVKQALEATEDEQQINELNILRSNLEELLELTRTTEVVNTVNVENDNLDDELQRFQSELQNLEQENGTSMNNEEEQQQLESLRAKYNALLGEKCSAPHEHSWGALSYHNALICGVDDEVIIGDTGTLDVRLRVLYTNPTHREMLPCSYYLDGECRFDETRCRFSHGALVPGAAIREYIPPDFHRLARSCPVLAKLQDRLWHRGRVLCVNFVEQQCRVRMDGQEHKERERDFAFEDLYPLTTDEQSDISSSNSSDLDGNSSESESETDSLQAAHRARMVELSLFTYQPSVKLGAWEKYTRGIGSKLMEKMGYVHGTGLGSDGRGIVTPLREAANGDKDYFSVERKLQRAQRRQELVNEKAYARECQRTDVFDFLNKTVLAEPLTKQRKSNDLQQHSNKTLNVETVRIADDIRRKQREIVKLEQSLARNGSDKQLQKRVREQLQQQQHQLSTLQAQESNLSKEQQTRKSKNKMFEF